MKQRNASPDTDPPPSRSAREKRQAGSHAGKRSSQKKAGTDQPAGPAPCFIIDGEGSCPEWENLLSQFPMIDSVQREDFPEHGASFAYLAHFYRTRDTAEESVRAQEEFEAFFRTIGYTCDFSGNFESRWFEGIGVRIG